MAVPEIYLAAKNATTVLNGQSLEIMSGSFTIETSEDDMTNNLSGGWYESVGCVNKASGSFQVAFKTSNTPTVLTGLMYTFVYQVPTTGPYLAGNVRVNKFDFNGQDVKGGLKYTLSWTGQGPMTWSSSGQVTPP